MRETIAGHPATLEQPAILQRISVIDNEHSSAFQALSRLESAYQRLMNPSPEKVGGTATSAPTQPTLEARLTEAGKAATSLAGQLHSLADKFEKAI